MQSLKLLPYNNRAQRHSKGIRMSIDDRIANLETSIADLKHQLLTESSKDERIAIRQQISGESNLLAALIGSKSKQSGK